MKTRIGFVSNSSSASFIVKYVSEDNGGPMRVEEKSFWTCMYNGEVFDFGEEAVQFLAKVVHDGNFISCRVEED